MRQSHLDAGQAEVQNAKPALHRWRLGILAFVLVGLVAALVAGNILAVRLTSHTTTRPALTLSSFAVSGQGASDHIAGAPPATTAVTCNCIPSRTGSLTTPAGGKCVPPPTDAKGQLILVCISRGWLYAYQDGKEVFNAGVWTGMPQLPTPQGTFHIFYKGTNLVFTSPYPKNSPYWYYPTHINYAMEFDQPGYYLHDAWWHESFGPGANFLHQNPDGTWENGSYGCVGMTVASAKWLYNWSQIGTPVIITY